METPLVMAKFVDACREAAAGNDARERIAALLRELVANPVELASMLEPNEVVDVTPSGLALGGDRVFFEDDSVAVMTVDTLPGVLQPPHDHLINAFIGCFEGCEQQRFFVRGDDGVRAVPGRLLEAGEVLVLGADAIHAISAPLHERARAVHVYLGPISTIDRSVFHPETFEESPFETATYHGYCRPA